MPVYRLTTLGPCALATSDGFPVELSAGKALALLIYAGTTGEPLERDEAARLLWPALPPDRGRQSTRQALWLLRRELGADVFAPGDAIGLAAGVLEVDAVRLIELVSAGELDSAAELWKGPFLSSFALPGVPAWEEWVERERGRLEAGLGGALLGDGVALRGAGRVEAAEHRLRQAIEVQPYILLPRTELAAALLELGRPVEALEAVGTARREVPDGHDELMALERRALELLRMRSDASRHGGLALEFVGRAAELSTLTGLWRDARRKVPRHATISGPAGIGKSRLAEELRAVAELDGRAVRVKAHEGEARLAHALLGTFVRRLLALSGASGISPASESILAALVPSRSRRDLGDLAPSLASAQSLSDAVVDLIGAVAVDAPLLAIFDDAQWADVESLLILSRAMRVLRDEAVLAVMAYRSEDVAGNALSTIQRIERDDGSKPIRLRPLKRADVAELLASAIDAGDDAALGVLADRVFDATAGNPLFIVELLRTLRDEGVLADEGGSWHVRADRLPQRLRLPSSVEAVLDRRLELLDEDAATILAVLARHPAALPRWRAAQESGISGPRFEQALQRLLEAEIVAWSDGDLAFSHDRIREVAVRRFPPVRRTGRRWHWVAIAGIALVAAALATWAIVRTGSGQPVRFGGGTLYVLTWDSAYEVRPTRSGFDVRRSRHWPGNVVALPFRSTDGPVRFLGTVQGTQDAPYFGEAIADTAVRVLARHAHGDTGPGALSPDGRSVVYLTENLATRRYDIDVMIASADGSHPRLLHRSAEKAASAEWSPDGQKIKVQITGPRDTLLILRPDGAQVRAFSYPSIVASSWCDSNRVAFVAEENDRSALLVGRVSDGSVTHVRGLRPLRSVACSPDGNAAALVGATPVHRLGVVIQPLDGSAATVVPVSGGDVRALSWLPDTVSPVVTGLRLSPFVQDVRWGERTRLTAAVVYSDESRKTARVTWRSADPGIASVTDDGTVTANAPGSTWVAASAGGFLNDSVRLTVTGALARGLLFLDRFNRLDSRSWWAIGDPVPLVRVAFDGRSALFLNGDGQYLDGLLSRRAWALPRGGTLTMDFSLTLSRPDRQAIFVCLAQVRTVGDTIQARLDRWQLGETGCFRFPWSELMKFDPRAGAVSANTESDKIRMPKLADSGWYHLSLQLRADGTVAAFVNQQLVGVTEIAVSNDPIQKWHILLTGASLDTHIWIRNVVLWEGTQH